MAISEVFLEDCIRGMKRYPDGYFDLAVVDPPYGIGIVAPGKRSMGHRAKQKRLTTYKPASWDNSIPGAEYFNELFRVSKNQVIWGANYFTQFIPPSPGWLVWDKNQPEYLSFAMAELAYTSYKHSAKIYDGKTYRGGRPFNEKKIHPTQKPVELYNWILFRYAQPGYKILDTHLGSGSHRIAAYWGGYDFVGFEIDKDYFEAAEKRFQLITSQTKLFQNDTGTDSLS